MTPVPLSEEHAIEAAERATPLHPISQCLHEQRTTGERLADKIAAQIGSWRT